MRVVVFFDLPVETSTQRKEYSKFRKYLLSDGFIMMQYSVYSKIALNGTVAGLIKDRIRKRKPKEGLVQLLVITERQFTSIEYVLGESQSVYLESTDRFVVL